MIAASQSKDKEEVHEEIQSVSSKIQLQTSLAVKENLGNLMALKFKKFNIEAKKKKIATNLLGSADKDTIKKTREEIEKLQNSISKIKQPKHFSFDLVEENAGF